MVWAIAYMLADVLIPIAVAVVLGARSIVSSSFLVILQFLLEPSLDIFLRPDGSSRGCHVLTLQTRWS
jgi:hypothetical protein